MLLESFRTSGQRAAFVLDEFGSVMGMVTLIDLIETIVGDLPSQEEHAAMPIQQRTHSAGYVHMNDMISNARHTNNKWMVTNYPHAPYPAMRCRHRARVVGCLR